MLDFTRKGENTIIIQNKGAGRLHGNDTFININIITLISQDDH